MYVSTRKSGNVRITSGKTIELTRAEFDAAVAQVTGMITVKYQVHHDDIHTRGEVDLPSWCSGDPRAAVSLYLFGHAHYTDFDVLSAEVVADDVRPADDEAEWIEASSHPSYFRP